MHPHRRSQRVAMIAEGPSGRLKLCATTTMSQDAESAALGRSSTGQSGRRGCGSESRHLTRSFPKISAEPSSPPVAAVYVE